jgi:hypothetical protein
MALAHLLAQASSLWPAHASQAHPARARHAGATHGHGRSGHSGEPIIDSTTVKVLNKPRGNGHWTSSYMPLQENLGREVGKGVLTRRGCFCSGARTDGKETLVRGWRSGRGGQRSGRGGAPGWRGACCWVSGVREQLEWAAAGEAIMEEDDGGEIPWPASLAGAAGRLLVQEGRGNEALLLAWLDSSGWLLGDWQRWAK